MSKLLFYLITFDNLSDPAHISLMEIVLTSPSLNMLALQY